MYRKHTDEKNNALSTKRPSEMVEWFAMPEMDLLPVGTVAPASYRHLIDVDGCDSEQQASLIDGSSTLRTKRAGPGAH
ncbi:MAG: hypothetical protein JXJ17_13670 [Anaerolineae bacterium]|nr:hypothetical protein [Anaerolineae bacterium]